MKSNRLSIIINKSAKDVFEFVTNPKNSPKWENFTVRSETNEWPPKMGTIYTDYDESGDGYEYEVTEFKPDKIFTLSQTKWGFHASYTLIPLEEKSTKLDFREWVDKGELEEFEKQETLEKLKKVIEAAK